MIKKNALRIGTFLAILLFLLIPLLSQPVAAANTFDLSTAWTDNTPAGPTVWWAGANPPGAYTQARGPGAATVTFDCDFSFSDTSGNPNIPSSRHYGELNVQRVIPGPPGPLLVASTGNVFLNNGQSTIITLSITDNYNPAWPTVTWDVWVYVECEDLPTGTMAWNTWYWTFTI